MMKLFSMRWSIVLLAVAAVTFWSSAGMAQTEWEKYPGNPVLDVGPSGSWDDSFVTFPFVLGETDGTYKMYYRGGGSGSSTKRIGVAHSSDGINWTKDSSNPIVEPGPPGSWDEAHTTTSFVLKEVEANYKMWYAAWGPGADHSRIGYATSPDGINWTKYPDNPVFSPDPDGWDYDAVFAPSVLKEDGGFYAMWYAGGPDSGHKLGLAISPDGINWDRHPANPILDVGAAETWDDRNVESPSVLKESDGSLKMWYHAKGSSDKIGYAISIDDCWDMDGDIYLDEACGGLDCDDSTLVINPSAVEICDEVDWDCSGDPFDRDIDGDGHSDDDPGCMGDDCDDLDPDIYLGAPELCDGKDNDCDGVIEADGDVDGWMDCEGDCDDTDPEINPGAVEICSDGIDNDCDGFVDGDDTDCAPFILELDASYSTSAPGMLDLDFRIAAAERCVWMTVAIKLFPSVQIIPLWMDFLPVTHPAVDMELSVPFTEMGWVVIYSGLYYGGAKQIQDMEWVYAGK